MSALRALPLVLIVFAGYFLLSAAVDTAKLKLTIEGSQIQFEPGYVRLRIRVEPDRENRALAVGIVSDGFETSSYEQLEGDRAPITRWVVYKDVPAGSYWAVADVARGAEDSWHTETAFTVLSRGY